MLSRDYSQKLSELLNGGASIDDALFELRENGATIIESIKAVRAVQGQGLGEAKRAVHLSPAWADMREQHDRLHEELDRLAQEWEDEDQ